MLQQKPKAKVKATPDSTNILMDKQKVLKAKALKEVRNTYTGEKNPKMGEAFKAVNKNTMSIARQANKGKAGYDKNGYPIKRK